MLRMTLAGHLDFYRIFGPINVDFLRTFLEQITKHWQDVQASKCGILKYNYCWTFTTINSFLLKNLDFLRIFLELSSKMQYL